MEKVNVDRKAVHVDLEVVHHWFPTTGRYYHSERQALLAFERQTNALHRSGRLPLVSLLSGCSPATMQLLCDRKTSHKFEA